MHLPALSLLQKDLVNFRTFENPSAISHLCFGSKFLESGGLRVVCVLARKVIMEPRLPDAGTNMIRFPLSFETPIRPELLRLNSLFNCSPHPLMTKRNFWVFASTEGDGLHSSSCAYRTHELKQGEAGGLWSRSKEAIVIGAANA